MMSRQDFLLRYQGEKRHRSLIGLAAWPGCCACLNGGDQGGTMSDREVKEKRQQ